MNVRLLATIVACMCFGGVTVAAEAPQEPDRDPTIEAILQIGDSWRKNGILPPNDIEVEVLLEEASSLCDDKQYDRAVIVGKKALQIAEKNHGEDDSIWVLDSLDRLARAYEGKGEYALAEPLRKRALANCENGFGDLLPSEVEQRVRDLAQLYLAQGKYALAEPLFRRSLAITMRGAEGSWQVGANLSGLADIYRARGEYVLAQPLYKRAITSVEQSQLVPPQKAALRKEIVRKLAELYELQGEHEKARRLYEHELAEK